MNKKLDGYISFIFCVIVVITVSIVFILKNTEKQNKFVNEEGIEYIAKVQGKDFLIYQENQTWDNSFLAGVDIGAGKPGYYPGELAISEDEYYEWFKMIGEMNSKVIRIYIPQSPQFYKALYKYNKSSKNPLYLMQGVYVNEEEMNLNPNIMNDDSKAEEEFIKDIKDAVNMIHGNANIEEQRGKAYGKYKYDVSQYVIGWILGIEFNADVVSQTNSANEELTFYDGKYVYTNNASPFEIFLAEVMDTTIEYESNEYKMQRPVAVCNWVTTDPLEHLNEPNKEAEDSEVLDVEHILAKENFEPGFFASYHAYPYYPESIMYDSKYKVEGSSSYKEYLKELNNYHSMPVLISEFGVPSSRGITHIDKDRGFNQGHMSEKMQGEAISAMIDEIYDSRCMGGIVFSWQDEWFKTTWNTMDFDNPNRRPYWHDMQTSEQNFGIMSFKPINEVIIDGNKKGWRKKDIVSENNDGILYAKYDSSYLYLMAEVSDFSNSEYIIPIDVIPNQGNSSYLNNKFSNDADFIIVLNGKDNSTVLVDPYYNLNFKQYGELLYSNDDMKYYNIKNSGEFINITQVLNKPLVLPETNETVPFEEFNTGKLTYGITDIKNENYNSLADFYESDNIVEIRIPWLLLNIADPSTKEIVSNLQEHDKIQIERINNINMGIAKMNNSEVITMKPYEWDEWEQVEYKTQLKQSYYYIKEAFAKYRIN